MDTFFAIFYVHILLLRKYKQYVLLRTDDSFRSEICAPTVWSAEGTWASNTASLDLSLSLRGIEHF